MRYRVQRESRGPDGMRRHHSKTCTTKKAAETLLAELLDEVNVGTFIVASIEALAAYLNRWFAALVPRITDGTLCQVAIDVTTVAWH